jgi:hypothetical protein
MFAVFPVFPEITYGFFTFYYTFLSLTFPPNILNIAFLLGEELGYCFELLLYRLPLFVDDEEFESCLDMFPD